MARGVDKYARDGGIERRARWRNKQQDENSAGELGVRERWGHGVEGWGCGNCHARALGISRGERNTIKTQHLPNAAHLNSSAKH